MPPIVNLHHLETHAVALRGELSAAELDLDPRDEAIRSVQPLEHDLMAQKLDQGILVQGRLRLTLDCLCVRCLKVFQYHLEIGDWTRHLPLQGEDRVAVSNDCVDLTPFVREDILLELPRHPVCEPGCRGLPKTFVGNSKSAGGAGKSRMDLSAWAELNKLEL